MKISPKKSLGQNFLSDPRILNRIVSVAEIKPSDTILEIGPGTGSLTKKLSEKAHKVISIEKDHRLIEELRTNFSSKLSEDSSVEIIEGDILKLDLISISKASGTELGSGNYKIVANIPYYITSHLLRIIFEEWPRPELIVFTIQKEVARRIVAKPPEMNLLALSVQFYADAKIKFSISRRSFRPVPKVDSAVISLRPKTKGLKKEEAKNLFKVVKLGFAQKRKLLLNNLSSLLPKEKLEKIFKEIGLDPNIRAQNLPLEDWQRLTGKIFALKS